MKGSERLLSPFPPGVVNGLIEFNRHISQLDSDYIVFMARKALRLHDLLILCGGREPDRPLYSHHIFDQPSDNFRGKHITLVDDTLILGSTLGAHERHLRSIGASVSSIVFAIDQDNHVPELVKPIRQFRKFDHHEMMTFCAAEVKALQRAGIPYLTDFPLTRRERISRDSFARMQCLMEWDMYCTSVDSTEGNQCHSYTFLPTSELVQQTNESITTSPSPITEIVKVRAFVAKSPNGLWIRFAPIVTFRALSQHDVSRLFAETMANVLESEELHEVVSAITSTKSKLRFLQYTYSSFVGQHFLAELKRITGPRSIEGVFDTDEAVRYFGDWLRTPIEVIHSEARDRLTLTRPSRVLAKEISLPREVITLASSDFDEMPIPHKNRSRNIFTNLVLLFVELYKRHEVPARVEARQLGAELFATPNAAPHRDRLGFGFSWELISGKLLVDEKSPSARKKGTLSLLLDQLIDMGIAVPVLAEKEGVYFRGYRHGEDVLFAEQEIALVHDMLRGYCESADRMDFPDRIVLEKLIACLLRIGAAKGLLEVIHGRSGNEGIARVGFHIHGAIPFIPDSDSYIAENKASWISVYLKDRGVLEDDGTTVRLGVKPKSVQRIRDASREAELLGNLLGKVLSAKTTAGRVMTVNEFMLAVTCPSAKDVVGALVAELRIAVRWSNRILSQMARSMARGGDISPESACKMHKRMTNGEGYTAIHSARVKYVGFMSGEVFDGVNRGYTYLKENDSTGINIEAKTWSNFWAPIQSENTVDKMEDFSNDLNYLAREIKFMACAVFAIELAVATLMRDGTNYGNVCAKIRGYLGAMDEHCESSGRDKKFMQRIMSLTEEKSEMPNPGRTVEFASGQLEKRSPRLRDLVSGILCKLEGYGRIDKRRTFHYLLWYDIIDSTGEKTGYVDHELRQYRGKVRKFTNSINAAFSDLIITAKQSGTIVCPSNGPVHSDDDEKHLFFSGGSSREWLEEAIRILVRPREDIRCRIVAVRADFAGVRAHNYEQDPMIRSKPMWEHLSRLKMRLKEVENNERVNKIGEEPSKSLLWVCGALISELADCDVLKERYLCTDVKTKLDGVAVSTRATLMVI